MNSNSHASLLLSATELAKSFKEAKQAYYAEQNRCTTEIVALEKAEMVPIFLWHFFNGDVFSDFRFSAVAPPDSAIIHGCIYR